jgi:aspartyl-tRNA(Asn)/glutamyl-tRNA(Gln) amidotransferase subunit B
LSRDNLKFSSLSNDKYDKFIKLIKLLQSGKINGKQAKVIFEQIYSSNIEPETLIEKLGFKQIMDEQVISNYFSKYIDANSNMLNEYKTRPERVEKYFIGMLMKDTKGQANPNISMQILKKMLKKYE